MNQPATQANASPPWFLIVGLLAGIAFIGYIVWDSSGASTNVVVLTEANWQKEVVESKIPVVVDFTASWCGPCQSFAPTVKKLADKYHGKVKIAKFDVGDPSFDKARNLTEKYPMRGVPHVMIFNGGDQPVQQFTGAMPEATLAKVIDDVLASRR